MRLSYSQIRCLRTCQQMYYLKYILGIRRTQQEDHFRIGTNWHELQEKITPLPPLEQAEAVLKVLDESYAVSDPSFNREKLEIEYRMLLYGYLAWQAHWKEDNARYEIIGLPEKQMTQNVSPGVRIKGVIDVLVKDDRDKLWVREYKTTSENIADSADYWKVVQRDIQAPIYVLLGRAAGFDIQGVQYDVFRKPQIKPKKPVKKDLVCRDRGKNKYLGIEIEEEDFSYDLETPVMFGIRLHQHIMATPDYYFARREVPCTDGDLVRAKKTVKAFVKQVRHNTLAKCWIESPERCLEYGKCSYWPICSNNVNPEGQVPMGFEKRKKHV